VRETNWWYITFFGVTVRGVVYGAWRCVVVLYTLRCSASRSWRNVGCGFVLRAVYGVGEDTAVWAVIGVNVCVVVAAYIFGH
jgi:hypothetical protein